METYDENKNSGQYTYLDKESESMIRIWRFVCGIISIFLSFFEFLTICGWFVLAAGIVSLALSNKFKRSTDVVLLMLFALGAFFCSLVLTYSSIEILLYIWCVLCTAMSMVMLILSFAHKETRKKFTIVICVIAIIALMFSVFSFTYGINNYALEIEEDFSDEAYSETDADVEEQIERDAESETQEDTEETEAEETAEAEAEDERQAFIDSCITVNYTDVERRPDDYDGTNIVISGTVIQVAEGMFNSVTLRVEESWDSIWYVTYNRSDDEDRILEDDTVTIYGTCTGTETYRSALGGVRVTIPSMKAEYVIIE